jgi:DNA-binding NarL/FixJ family response regulator
LRILVVDDHEAVRKGVCTVVQTLNDVEVCGEAANGLEAIDRARELKPDLIIMDITMPIVDGFKASRLIRDILPEASILLLSMHNGSKLRHIAMSVGAHGFVCKDQGVGVLRQAINAVTHNQTFFP